MSGFYQWETVDLQIVIEDEEGNPKAGVLDNVRDVVVSIAQNCSRIDLHIDELDIDAASSAINLHLSQEDAGSFSSKGSAQVQVNILYEGGERDVTVKGTVEVFGNLYGESMS